MFADWPAGEKIQELINALDMRKNEAIERTFKGVAKNFRYSPRLDQYSPHPGVAAAQHWWLTANSIITRALR